jgi:hypothetical protein
MPSPAEETMTTLSTYYDALECFLVYGNRSGYEPEEIEALKASLDPEDQAELNSPKQTEIWFVEPTTYHNNFGIELRTNNPVAYRVFKHWAHQTFGTDCPDGAFFQGDKPDEWFYIEFWHHQTAAFRAKIETKIQEALNLLKGINP